MTTSAPAVGIDMAMGASAASSASSHQQQHDTRRWRQLPGRNRYCCDGRIIMSHQSGVFYFTLALIISTMALFFVYDAPFLWENVSPALPLIAAALLLMTLAQLLKTSFSDPGVVPRSTAAERQNIERQIEAEEGQQQSSATYRPPPRTKDVLINGQPVKLKYCFTCHIFRPPRTSHCSVCDNCIMNFDHHCKCRSGCRPHSTAGPWVGNCVGERNYRHFYLFITILSLLCIFTFACSILHLILFTTMKDHTFLATMEKTPGSLIVSIWSVAGLSGYHTYLITSALTTNEDLKGSYNPKRQPNSQNPYSSGNMFRNCFDALCRPEQPSVLNRRGLIRETFVCMPVSGHYDIGTTTMGLPSCTVERTDSDDMISGSQMRIVQAASTEETNGGSDSASSTVHMLNTGSGGATMETALMSYGAVENKLR